MLGRLTLCAALCLALPAAKAQWLAPGDLRARHEIQLLADSAVLSAPVSSWPLDLADLEITTDAVPAELLVAAGRVRALHEGAADWSIAAGGSNRPEKLRTFEELPREQAQVTAGFDASFGRVALALELTRTSDPADGDEWRGDGSYAGAAFGNWFVALGANDRWWGPGWDGSLIMSSNARPIPAVTLARRRAKPFTVPVLRRLGPWTTQVLIGQLEADRHVPHTRLFGWRFAAKPLPRLELGLSRAAQWCGDGRPCGFDTFLRMLSGTSDNVGDNVSASKEPGNQLAGFDLRYAFSLKERGAALYAQRIGEDELGGLPSAWLSLFGLETWGLLGAAGSSYRLHAEYAETTCGANHFSCAYNHYIYRGGYRYKGRPIGHALDGDGVMASIGALLVDGAGHTWQALLRRVELNRGNDPQNTVAARKEKLVNLELSHTRYFEHGSLTAGLARDDGELDADGSSITDTRAYLEWRWRAPTARAR